MKQKIVLNIWQQNYPVYQTWGDAAVSVIVVGRLRDFS
jgi:hypothetical protein